MNVRELEVIEGKAGDVNVMAGLPERLYRKLKLLSATTDISMAAIIRTSLDDTLEGVSDGRIELVKKERG